MSAANWKWIGSGWPNQSNRHQNQRINIIQSSCSRSVDKCSLWTERMYSYRSRQRILKSMVKINNETYNRYVNSRQINRAITEEHTLRDIWQISIYRRKIREIFNLPFAKTVNISESFSERREHFVNYLKIKQPPVMIQKPNEAKEATFF